MKNNYQRSTQAKALIFVLYFGQFPNYFKLWLDSAEKNKDLLDFYIITDQDIDVSQFSNIFVSKMKFDELRNIFIQKFNFHICLDAPYKLCDFRPAYGDIFDEYIDSSYEYWGFCDIDLIFGNVGKFLSKTLGEFDKISFLGHFQLYRNNNMMKKLYTFGSKYSFNYKKVFSNKGTFIFDEQLGINMIAMENNISTLELDCLADISPQYKNFSVWHDYPDKKNFFVYDGGSIKRYLEYDKGKYEVEEYMYLHMQKRDLEFNSDMDISRGVTIVPNRIIQGVHKPTEVFKEICISNSDNSNEKYVEFMKKRHHSIYTSPNNFIIAILLKLYNKRYQKMTKKNIVKISQLN